MAEFDERLALINRLVGEDSQREHPGDRHVVVENDPPGDDTRPVLRGPEIRAAAVRVLLAHPRRPEALHYREWFQLLTEAGYAVAGKDPLAVFLTQLSRSPLVHRGTQGGVYELDLQAPARLRRQLEDLQVQLRQLTAASSAATDLSSIRCRRTALSAGIGKVERALEEVEETLRRDPKSSDIAEAS